MKKLFVSTFVMALMVTGSALSAQEVEGTIEAEAAETVAAAVDESDTTTEESVVVDAQGSLSDGVAAVSYTHLTLPTTPYV